MRIIKKEKKKYNLFNLKGKLMTGNEVIPNSSLESWTYNSLMHEPFEMFLVSLDRGENKILFIKFYF